MSGPLVSVVIPVYQGRRFLAETLESALAQDHRPIEVVVVDDGSRDGSAEVVAEFPEVRLVHQENQGVAAARNAGIAASRGEVIALLDQDDLWAPEKLRRQLEALVRDPVPDLVYCRLEVFAAPGEVLAPWAQRELALSRERDLDAILPSALLARRHSFERVGEFATRFRSGGDDVDWLARARGLGMTSFVVQEPLLRRRLHGGNLSGSPEGPDELLAALRAKLRRERGEA